jgi:hypothetical protein
MDRACSNAVSLLLHPILRRIQRVERIKSPHHVAPPSGGAHEVRLRVAARTQNRRHAEYVAQEVQTLLINGPYGGGGDFMQVRDLIGVASVLLPRRLVHPRVEVLT